MEKIEWKDIEVNIMGKSYPIASVCIKTNVNVELDGDTLKVLASAAVIGGAHHTYPIKWQVHKLSNLKRRSRWANHKQHFNKQLFRPFADRL